MAKLADELKSTWRARLCKDCPQQNRENRESITCWLLGEDLERFDRLTLRELAIANQAMDYRFRILQQRYLTVEPAAAYRSLIVRLGSVAIQRYSSHTWLALSCDRQGSVADAIQGMIQEMLSRDRYIRQQITWIAQCTQDLHLRDALLLASIEEYCLRPLGNQPLLVYHLVNFLCCQTPDSMTEVPQRETDSLMSEAVNLAPVDFQAIAEAQQEQNWEQQQRQRVALQQKFERYLTENVGGLAVDWLRLYLLGRSQKAIAQILNLPLKQVSRLREQVTAHAIEVFSLTRNELSTGRRDQLAFEKSVW